jgi:hypothetical protein
MRPITLATVTALALSTPSAAQTVSEMRGAAEKAAIVAAYTFWAGEHCGGGTRSETLKDAIEGSKAVFPGDWDLNYIVSLRMISNLAEKQGERFACRYVNDSFGPNGDVAAGMWLPRRP